MIMYEFYDNNLRAICRYKMSDHLSHTIKQYPHILSPRSLLSHMVLNTLIVLHCTINILIEGIT
jgi:hypothetical protein